MAWVRDSQPGLSEPGPVTLTFSNSSVLPAIPSRQQYVRRPYANDGDQRSCLHYNRNEMGSGFDESRRHARRKCVQFRPLTIHRRRFVGYARRRWPIESVTDISAYSYVVGIWGFKQSLLMSYMRFFPKEYRIATLAVMGIVGAAHIAFLCVFLFLCTPVRFHQIFSSHNRLLTLDTRSRSSGIRVSRQDTVPMLFPFTSPFPPSLWFLMS